MGEPWIRVHAILIDKPVVARAVEALGVDEHAAVGLLVTFWGSVARNVTGGRISGATDAQLELWARWRGKRGRFAAFIRGHHIDPDGRVNEWDEYAGALENRREKERTRLHNKRHGVDQPSRNGTQDVAQQYARGRASVATRAPERNGTERNVVEIPSSESSNRRSGVVPLAGARTSETAVDPDDAVFRLVGVQRFVEHFYRRAGPKRHADVARQLALVAGRGAPHPAAPKDPNALIRARSLERLERRCLEVVREGVRDHDKAIVVLLLKLADTSDISERTAAADHEQRDRDELQQRRDLVEARAWLDGLRSPPAWLQLHTASSSGGISEIIETKGFEYRLLAEWRRAGAPHTERAAS